MNKLNLTRTERLILANQYEILGYLKDEPSYLRLSENLKDGHKWIYEQKIDICNDLSESESEYILKILSIYSDLKDSYDQLSDKSGIEKNSVTFPGFDGNNETEYLHFTKALTENGNYRSTIGETARNSHFPTTHMYERIISKWESLGRPQYPLSKEHIIQIIEARVHPDSTKKA